MSEIEKMNEMEWRAHISKKVSAIEVKLADGQSCFTKINAALLRIENNTKLARDAQDLSKAANLLYQTTSKVMKVILRLLCYGAGVTIVLYMMTHHGEVPVWGRPWLAIMEK